ncbi:MAG TPA: trehalose-6-phosphate synthase [bacterium]|nr:trehalose-6-phosphate synthase [bacterium]
MRPIIRWIIAVVLAAVVAVVASSYWNIRREQEALRDDLSRRARVIAKSLAPGALRALRHPSTPDEEDLAERLSGPGRTVGIVLCSLAGETVARSAALEGMVDCPDIDPAGVSKDVDRIAMQDLGGHSFHILTIALLGKAETLGTLTIVHDAGYIKDRARQAAAWTALTVSLFTLVVSFLTYVLSRLSFRTSVQQMLEWMKASKGPEILPSPTASLLRPVTREVEKLTARLRAARETAREISEERTAVDLWTPARLKAHALTHLGGHPLIVVSNREPYVHVKEHGRTKVLNPASGLVTAMDPVLKATSGLWIAHGAGNADRETSDREGKLLVPPGAPSYTLKRIWLTREEEEHYYYGFSNEALWPLCLMTHHRPKFEEMDWEVYVRVNRKFADAVVRECGKERPVILIQDYHFTLLPQFIREKRPDAVIGLFWHIPWPTSEVFQVCPWKREILKGMMGADLVGFHLQSHGNNFLDTVNSLLPVRVDWDRFAVVHESGSTAIKALPISIQPWAERGIPEQDDLEKRWEEWTQELDLKKERLLVSVDRLDYAKGIPERLGAIDRFLEKNPRYRGQVRFVQLIAPSRMHLPAYRELLAEIEKLAEEVNWKHATDAWKPVTILKAQHDPQTVYTFLRMSEVCIVSSLADGMNLVAKEFVAARERSDGALILSEFTGAALEFQEALQVNPYARADFAEAIRIALEMPEEERRRRMTRMKARVAENNVYKWAADLLGDLARTEAAREVPSKDQATQ